MKSLFGGVFGLKNPMSIRLESALKHDQRMEVHNHRLRNIPTAPSPIFTGRLMKWKARPSMRAGI